MIMVKGAGDFLYMQLPSGVDGGCQYGDIYALAEDSAELEALGVVLGRFNAELRCFEGCRIPFDALQRLQALGGKYLWELIGEPGCRHVLH